MISWAGRCPGTRLGGVRPPISRETGSPESQKPVRRFLTGPVQPKTARLPFWKPEVLLFSDIEPVVASGAVEAQLLPADEADPVGARHLAAARARVGVK